MSYTIDFDRLSFQCPLQDGFKFLQAEYPKDFQDYYSLDSKMQYHDYTGNFYLVFTEIGDSRTFDLDDKIARKWQLSAHGSSPMKTILSYAQDAETGALKLGNRHTLPENYIKTYRQTIAIATPTKQLMNAFANGHLLIELRGLNGYFNEEQKQMFQRIEAHPYTRQIVQEGRFVEHGYLSQVVPVIKLNFTDYETHAMDIAWLSYILGDIKTDIPYGHGHGNCLSKIVQAKKLGAYRPAKVKESPTALSFDVQNTGDLCLI